MTNPRLHGIRNCDTVARARAWFSDRGLEYDFHDFKRAGVPAERLDAWIAAIGWDKLLNRKGTMWRRLPEATRAEVVDAPSARALMLAQPSVIKRPVVDWPDGQTTVGFDVAEFERRAG